MLPVYGQDRKQAHTIRMGLGAGMEINQQGCTGSKALHFLERSIPMLLCVRWWLPCSSPVCLTLK